MDDQIPDFHWPTALPRTCTRDMLFLAIKEWAMGAKPQHLAEILNVPRANVGRFTSHPEWHTLVKKLRPALDLAIENRITRNLKLALHELEDRLAHGNKVVNRDGVEHRAPLSASELNVIAANLFDRRAHARKITDGIDAEQPDIASSLGVIAELLRKHNTFAPSQPKTVDAEVIQDSQ